MPIYPTLAVIAAVAVVGLELAVFRSGLFRQAAYWIAMAIVFGFMIPVDGWLTKLSAPIVIYRDGDTSGLRPVWDIPLEEFAYAFALLTLVILVWDRPVRARTSALKSVAMTVVGASRSSRLVRRDGGASATRPHRWVMHGRGMGWHRSHHAPPAGRFERNDLFPLCFSVLGFALFARCRDRSRALRRCSGSVSASPPTARATCRARGLHPPRACGAAAGCAYLTWLRDSHRCHHRFGGEPYGMLLPFVSRAGDTPRRHGAGQSLARSARAADRRHRATRSRL